MLLWTFSHEEQLLMGRRSIAHFARLSVGPLTVLVTVRHGCARWEAMVDGEQFAASLYAIPGDMEEALPVVEGQIKALASALHTGGFGTACKAMLSVNALDRALQEAGIPEGVTLVEGVRTLAKRAQDAQEASQAVSLLLEQAGDLRRTLQAADEDIKFGSVALAQMQDERDNALQLAALDAAEIARLKQQIAVLSRRAEMSVWVETDDEESGQ